MHVRPVTHDDLEELARAFKVVIDERRWVAIQPPMSVAELAEGMGERLDEGRLMFALEDEDAEGGPALVGHIDLHRRSTNGLASSARACAGTTTAAATANCTPR